MRRKAIKKLLANKEFLIPLLIVVMTIITHGLNLFHFPYFENDEGVYTSQAWWLVHFGKLGPYTYWYDHSPVGWLQIGLWQLLTGGPFTFGFSLYSTRILMVLVSTISNLLLYIITYRLTRNRTLALLASILFAFSPLAIKFHRRVLLDNFQVLWFLASFYFVLDPRARLSRLWLSGITFGLAFLSKEVTIFFLPAFIYFIWSRTREYQRRYGVIAWVISTSFLLSLFPLLALVKKEFFPSGWLENAKHVSLIETVMFQMQRGNKLPPWEVGSDFYSKFLGWTSSDPILFKLGLVSILINLLRIKKSPESRTVAFLGLSYLVFLFRGGLILDFYVIPFLPLLALNIAQTLTWFESTRFRRWRQFFSPVEVVAAFLILVVGLVAENPDVYLGNETSQQLAGFTYVRQHIPSNSFVVIDDFALIDYKLALGKDSQVFANAEWFYKVEEDPEIREEKLGNSVEKIDYILLSHEMVLRMEEGKLPFLKEAYDHSTLMIDFPPGPKTYRDLSSLKSTNGDWATLLKVSPPSQVAIIPN